MAAPAAPAKTFEYAVRDARGKLVKGRIEASNQSAVASRLRSMGLAPVSIAEVSTTGLRREITIPGLGSRVGLKDLAVMSRQLATMISAGLSLLRGLGILADQTESPALAKILTQVRTEVEAGTALSVAMAKHREFPPLMVNMIRAGETGGFLEDALVSIANNYEGEVKLRGKIKSAMTYPVVVFVMAIVGVVAMLIFIVPVFKDMFEGLGGELPLPTQLLVYLSEWMKWIAPVLVVATVAGVAWWRRHGHDEAVRARVDPVLLRLPVFGLLLKKIGISRFTRTLGTMLGAGVPILQALDIVGQTSGNWVIERAVRDVQESVRSGQSLAGPLAQHPVFPSMVTQMIAVGEDSGALEVMLSKIADFYDQEVEATTEQLTALIEPLMIAVLGVIIGGMIVALYLPIFNIFDLVQ